MLIFKFILNLDFKWLQSPNRNRNKLLNYT